MGALTYLLLVKLKNNLIQLLKSPAKLIYTIFMIACLVIVMVSGSSSTAHATEQTLNREYLVGGILAVYALMFYLSVNSGFNSGATIFRMPDVNLLFVGPYHPRTLLIYGVFQQLGTTLFAGVFLVFQYAWLNDAFGVTPLDMLFIMIGYILVLFVAQLLSMIIYCLTNDNEVLKKVLKLVLYLPLIVFAGYYFVMAIRNDALSIQILADVGNSAAGAWLPVYGWITALVKGVLLADTMGIVVGAIVSVITVAVVVILLFVIRMDYYEDVMQTTEAAYTSVTAAKEGRVQEAAPKNIKKGKMGIGKGFGANTFYYKHLIENRRGKILLLPTLTIVLCVCGIIASFFLKEIGLFPILAFMVYMKMFTIGMDRLPREMLKPYIYMVPESSFKKLLYCMLEAFPGYFAEAILLYVPAGVITGASVPEIIFFILVSVSFSFMFISANLFVDRIFGAFTSKMLLITIYMLLLLVLSAPGIAIGCIFAFEVFVIISETFTILLFMVICNFLLALAMIFASRNVLEYAEMNN